MIIHVETSGICLGCKALVSVVAGMGHNKRGPKANDYTVCGHCYRIGRFDENMNAVPVSPEQLVALFMEHQQLYEALMKGRNLVKRYAQS